MEKNKINFITGKTYTLAELFSGNRRIVIPDLQRDYCWGDETNIKATGEVGDLVFDFVNNLVEQYEAHEQGTLNLGLFYGYEVPANHIQLCDGQQRLTTLYLLLGMINRKVGKFRQHLISDYEYNHDDKEPYLNYAIRESSLYFLSDLVCRFFIKDKAGSPDNVDCIESAEWYFNDYKNDPSICSMLNALRIIEHILSPKDDEWLCNFGEWMLNKLTFLYFDMKTRKNGEETFVVINTTGEPLSVTQNLKPRIIQSIGIGESDGRADSDGLRRDAAKKWEDMEKWFWSKRQGSNDTADAGFAEFLRWLWIIERKDELVPMSENSNEKYIIQQVLQGKEKQEFPYKEINFDVIYGYWLALKWIMKDSELPFNSEVLSPEINKNVSGRRAIGQNECFVLLPVLSFAYRSVSRNKAEINVNGSISRNVRRLYEFFANIIRVDNVSRNVNTLVREALCVVDKLSEDGDIVSILQCSDVNESIVSEEERIKLEILKNTECRVDVEELFWKVQSRKIWSGEILPVVKWAEIDGMFNIERFRQYADLLDELLGEEKKHDTLTNMMRRCMIVNKRNYEPARRGMYSSFGWNWKDWRQLLCHEEDNTRLLLDYIMYNRKDDVSLAAVLEDYIKGREAELHERSKYADFAESNYLLSFTSAAESCDIKDEDNDILISISGGMERHTSFISRRNAIILQAFDGTHENNSNKKRQLDGMKNWSVWYWGGKSRDNCVVFEYSHDGKEIKLDTRFFSKGDGGGSLEVCLKSSDNKQDLAAYCPDILKSFPDCELSQDRKKAVVKKMLMDKFDIAAVKHSIEILLAEIDRVLTRPMPMS